MFKMSFKMLTTVALLVWLLPQSLLAQSTIAVYMEFQGSPELLDSNQLTRIEQLVQEAYNEQDLTTGSFTSPNKSITSVSIDSSTFNPLASELEGTSQPFTLLAQVECSGCESDGLLFSTQTGRSFFSYNPQYGVNTQVFIYRFNDLLASETALSAIESFNAVQQLEQILDCPLDNNDTVVESTIVLNVRADLSLVDDAQIAVLEQGFVDAYNFLNVISTTNRCDPFYRRIVNVTLTIPALEEARRRKLMGLNFTNLPSFFYFRPAFRCPFCPKLNLLFNDAARRRRLSNDVVATHEGDDFHRFAQVLNPSESDCICPVNPNVREAPTREELITTFNEFVGVAQTVGAVTFIEALDDEFVEVEEVECPAGFEELVQDVELGFEGDPEALTPAALVQLQDAFVAAYQELANNGCDPLFRVMTDAVVLSVRLVIEDPTTGRRTLSEPLEFEDFEGPLLEEEYLYEEHDDGDGPLDGRRLRGLNLPLGKPYNVTVRTRGRCKRCPRDSRLIRDNDAARRKLGVVDASGEVTSSSFSSFEHTMMTGRSLQVINEVQCFCDVEPTTTEVPALDEFVPVYENVLVNQLNVNGVDAITSAETTNNPILDEAYVIGLIQGLLPDTNFDNPDSPQSLALAFILADELSRSLSEAKLVERFGATTFWYSTAGPQCPDADIRGWLQPVDTCEWGGTDINCNGAGQVIELDMGFDGLCGEVPPETFLITTLEILHLASNGLTGSIPPGIASLPNLETLLLNNNDFTGGLPPFLGNLVNLKILRVSENENLRGDLPVQLGNLVNLEELSVTRCNMGGILRPELGNIGASMKLMLLHQNDFTGLIPASWSSFVNLERMLLFENNLDPEAAIPEALCAAGATNDIRVDRPAVTCSCCQCCFPNS